MATIILNDIVFTNRSDVVDGARYAPPSNLWVDVASSVSTKSGNDVLIGKADDATSFYIPDANAIGVLVQNDVSMNAGNDTLIGSASASAARGFVYGVVAGWVSGANGVISLGSGSDTMRGLAYSGSAETSNVGGISLFEGYDIDTGEGGSGGRSRGRDVVYGEARGLADGNMWGITLEAGSVIRTNDGNDCVTGIARAGNGASAFGISFADASSQILTGSGNDRVTAFASINNGQIVDGFTGYGLVDLGADDDILEGFGDLTAHGGAGRDRWILSHYKSTEFTIVKGNKAALEVTFSSPTADASVSGFELFVFANGTFRYADLV